MKYANPATAEQIEEHETGPLTIHQKAAINAHRILDRPANYFTHYEAGQEGYWEAINAGYPNPWTTYAEERADYSSLSPHLDGTR